MERDRRCDTSQPFLSDNEAPERSRSVTRRILLFVFLVLALIFPRGGDAHDIPATVIVRAFVKPEGDRLHVLVRVPLEAMRDIKWPVNGEYLDIARAEPLLANAAKLWIANYLDMYEGVT